MARIMLSYTLFWVRLGYRIWHGIAHWFLQILPMPPVNGQRDFPVGGQVISPSADS